MRPDDRKCLDKYLIKTFADNISISDAMRNLAITKNLMYITPDSLMKGWLKGNREAENGFENKSDRSSASVYDKVMQRAFHVLKEFYKKIQHTPFYKEYVYYPIYVEKTDRINTSDAAGIKIDVQMNYSFVILSNDLTKGLKINEMRYDENASLNFLYLFVEFFSGSGSGSDLKFGKSIHSFNKADYEFLIKLYQFIEQSGKDPINMTLDLYKLLGMIKESIEGVGKSKSLFTLKSNHSTAIDTLKTANLQKYKGLIKHKLVDVLEHKDKNSLAYQEEFIKMMNLIFKNEQLSGLYSGVEKDATMGERYKYTYNINKYREILNLAGELVNYNELHLKQVVSTDVMDFDFKVEQGEYSIETQSQVISQRYQEFFKLYVESIKQHTETTIKLLIDQINIEQRVAIATTTDQKNIAEEVAKIDSDRVIAQKVHDDAEAEIIRLAALETAARSAGDLETSRQYAADGAEADDIRLEQLNKIASLTRERADRVAFATLLGTATKEILINIIGPNSAYNPEMTAQVLAAMANDLTFIYDDGKRFFTSELVAEGFMKVMKDGGKYNILSQEGFGDMARDSISIDDTIDGEPNPIFYTAEVVSSLQDGFDMMAVDTITAIQDVILPLVQKSVRDAQNKITRSIQVNPLSTSGDIMSNSQLNIEMNKILTAISHPNFIPQDVKENLSQNVYRVRFINNILKNFSKMFRTIKVDKVLKFDQSVSQLHPLIKQMIKNGPNGEFFKSFIIKYETCEQLYNTKFLVDTQKFLYGLINQPPIRMTNQMNKLQVVIENYLGLKDNPTWVIGETDIFLSMPDGLSLTETSLLSKIPKEDLMGVCNIKASDYWNENTMGKVSNFDDKKTKEATKKLKKANQELKDAKDAKSKNSDDKKIKSLDSRVEKAEKKVDQAEEDMAKVKLENKAYLPNATLFNEEPEMAENQPLLSDAEKADLEKGKQDMLNQIHKLDKYDDTEIDQMLDNASNQTLRKNPFDTMDSEEDRGQNAENDYDSTGETKADEFLRDREGRRNPELEIDDDEELRRILTGNRR